MDRTRFGGRQWHGRHRGDLGLTALAIGLVLPEPACSDPGLGH
jgi:hypothetical protein